eukprot:CAMPEP_0203747700 /NCGR_PEP_ID=MMETSP0098-20131031/2777_1 /ASSEMBLY_ACC=CAM_ASM_000208 /TAXON_ID=96639 /ORGANISM=" , Strain NY0313808BC1" /LENGTH=334 /DNA_ID=CAMNT_0050636207 /DNA_START=196 /DNA_END=1200 /DNA_ORIENTATION=-
MSSRLLNGRAYVGVFGTRGDPVLNKLPSVDNTEFFVGHDASDFANFAHADKLRGLIVMPPTDNDALIDTWERCLKGKVEWVHMFAAGVDSIAPFTNKCLVPDDITLTNGRGAFSSSLGEYILAAALYFNKKMVLCQEHRKQKLWERFTMPTLKGKTMGFVGFGDIAKSAAKIARDGFGMKIAVYRRDPSKMKEGEADVVYQDKLDLFRESDFVVCSLPGTLSTNKFCCRESFQSMKRGSVFISCGRGVCVDEDALFDALASGHIYAGLDVFATEPLPKESKLWTLPDERVLITSHNADLTEDYMDLGWEIALKNLESFTTNQPYVTVVDKSLGY